MTGETCTYRFECEHADRYYMPEENLKKSESLLSRWIDRGLIWLVGLLLAANIANQLGKYWGWW